MVGKNKKKRRTETKDPESWKVTFTQEQGNNAFQVGDLDKALSCYTKGLECDPNHAIILSNRNFLQRSCSFHRIA